MDMTAIDVTDVDEAAVMRGTRAEILGANIPIDEVAAWAGTISYELLTRLGNRYARRYASLDSERHQ
jgi:alanine racemase